MKNISKDSLKERDELIQKIRKSKDDLEDEIIAFNRKVSELYNDTVAHALAQLNEDIDQLKEWANAIVEEAVDYANAHEN